MRKLVCVSPPCRASIIDGAPMTAVRFLSLYCKDGDDDMFSSDLTNDQLKVSNMCYWRENTAQPLDRAALPACLEPSL